MADNYLERRMEDLRNGKITICGAIPGIKPGSRRVVVAGGTSGKAYEKAMGCRNNGWRVAVMDSDEAAGRKMAYENGIRFHRTDLSDDETIRKETLQLLEAWRGVDLIIGNKEACLLIEAIVRRWKESLPIADKTPAQIVII